MLPEFEISVLPLAAVPLAKMAIPVAGKLLGGAFGKRRAKKREKRRAKRIASRTARRAAIGLDPEGLPFGTTDYSDTVASGFDMRQLFELLQSFMRPQALSGRRGSR